MVGERKKETRRLPDNASEREGEGERARAALKHT